MDYFTNTRFFQILCNSLVSSIKNITLEKVTLLWNRMNGFCVEGRANALVTITKKRAIICCPMSEEFWKHKYYFMFEKCKCNSTCQQSVQDVQVLNSPLDMICCCRKITTSKPEVNLGLSLKF